MKKNKSIIKNENGAVSALVLFTVLMFIVILMGVYLTVTARQKAQIKSDMRIEQVYRKDVNNIDNVYNEIISKSKTVQEMKDGDYFKEKTILRDSNGNIITVPEGFKIASDSGINVTEGIVIEDSDITTDGNGNKRGNQYVWIPVGKKIKKSDGSIVEIALGRYTFANGTSDKDSNGKVLSKGTPILKQSADNYTQEVLISPYYKEIATYRKGIASSSTNGLNATSRGKQKEDGTYEGIKSFIDSVKANGGYYIARYEASYGTDGKANSKISNTFTNSDTVPTKRTEGMLWNYIIQINAAIASRDLYTTATTDLISSYAWDTAIVYIQNFSGDADYSYQNSKNTVLSNTGKNGDEICKINDMASNTYEWTTEYSTYITSQYAGPCTGIGGGYTASGNYASSRAYNNANGSSKYYTFRTTLYM